MSANCIFKSSLANIHPRPKTDKRAAPQIWGGVHADFATDYYIEKTTYSSMTEPMVAKLKERGVDTIIITGFMTQFCSVTTSRHAHDLGFKVVFVSDACDGPILAELLSGVDENAIVPFHLGIAVVDTTTTQELLSRMKTSSDEL